MGLIGDTDLECLAGDIERECRECRECLIGDIGRLTGDIGRLTGDIGRATGEIERLDGDIRLIGDSGRSRNGEGVRLVVEWSAG
jgi:hypothetical protein